MLWSLPTPREHDVPSLVRRESSHNSSSSASVLIFTHLIDFFLSPSLPTMINDNPDPIAPVPVPSRPLLPSNTGILAPGNAGVALLLLQTVEAEGLHQPPKKISSAIPLLWTRARNGPFDDVYAQWAPARRNRQFKDRFDSILETYCVFLVTKNNC